ncbi:hypothetical protein Tco_1418969 [Tanacetum coccineum]
MLPFVSAYLSSNGADFLILVQWPFQLPLHVFGFDATIFHGSCRLLLVPGNVGCTLSISTLSLSNSTKFSLELFHLVLGQPPLAALAVQDLQRVPAVPVVRCCCRVRSAVLNSLIFAISMGLAFSILSHSLSHLAISSMHSLIYWTSDQYGSASDITSPAGEDPLAPSIAPSLSGSEQLESQLMNRARRWVVVWSITQVRDGVSGSDGDRIEILAVHRYAGLCVVGVWPKIYQSRTALFPPQIGPDRQLVKAHNSESGRTGSPPLLISSASM